MTQYTDSMSDELYDHWWQMAAAALISIGILTAAFRSLITLVDSFAVFALVGAVAALLVSQAGLPIDRKVSGREFLIGALVAGTCAGALSGLTTILGVSAIFVAVVVIVASPWVLGANWHWLDCESDAVLWGHSGYAPLLFQLSRGVTPVSNAGTSTIDWDELLGNEDGR